MKKLLLTLAAFILTFGLIKAQGPTISLVGSSPSFSKGNINTEILTEIIQQKQEEVKKKVFRNVVIKGFNEASFTENLKNFTTYHYLYNIMDAMTSGKNKTAITKSIIESSTEFSYVFGLALYVTEVKNKMSFGSLTLDASIFKNAEREIKGDKLEEPKDVKTFNLVIDICYDVILRDVNLQKTFKFKDDLTDKNFSTWYENDNCYKLTSDAFNSILKDLNATENLIILQSFGLVDRTEYDKLKNDDEKKNYLTTQQTSLQTLRSGIKIHLDNLSAMATAIQKTIGDLKTLESNIKDDGVKKSIDYVLTSLSDLPAADLKAKILKINTDYAAVLTNEQQTAIAAIANAVNNNYDQYRQLISFYVGLSKSDYKDFSLTKDQYYAMKYVLTQFLEFAKNQFDNHVAASVIDFMLENTIVEYKDAQSDNTKPEEESSVNDKGYLYIDIESLISAIDKQYDSKTRKSSLASCWWWINPRPFPPTRARL